MELLTWFFDFIMHLDKHLTEVVKDYGNWTYLILFLIVFCETGLVVTPFLPGDSLLFAVGALAATSNGALSPHWAFLILSVAAILGDTLNYWIGYLVGPKAYESGRFRFIKKQHLEKTHLFYEKYGKKTIILARFVPIVRTFAPFVAGIGQMAYGTFLLYNVIGGIVWPLLLVYAGYFFAETEVVRNRFSLVILAIIFLSILPMLFEFAKVWLARRKQRQAAAAVK